MEPIVHRCTMTKALFYEGMQVVLRDGYEKTAKKLILLLTGLWAIFFAVTLILKESMAFVLVESVVLGLIALWLLVYMPRRRANRAWKRLILRCGDDLERTTTCYDDRLTILAAGNETTVQYAEIAKILRTPHLLVLVDQNKTGVMLTHNGFTSGSEAELESNMKRYL